MLVEIGAFVAEMLGVELISKYKQGKRTKILERLSKLEIKRDDAELKKDELIACFLMAEDAISKSSSLEKMDKILNIYTGSIANGSIYSETDSYGEIMSIISDLSDREINLLMANYKFLPMNIIQSGSIKRQPRNNRLFLHKSLK
ncbi:hypothetical protein GJ26_18365 [Vibrio cholerae]|nr:hypothetical protein GJ26_18365 [Vibrio cholerae]